MDKNMPTTIGHLEISSWRGISVGAVHWYAKLIIDDETEKYQHKTIEVQRPISAKEARTMNAEFKEKGYFSRMYKAGSLTDGFNTEEEAINVGIKKFKSDFGDGILILGDYTTYSPWQKVIVWPKKVTSIVNEMNKIADEFAKSNGWEGNEKAADRLYAKWDKRYKLMTELCK